jgi:hypothetical protein
LHATQVLTCNAAYCYTFWTLRLVCAFVFATCRLMVQPRFNARADLQRLVERRMLQLVGAGLRCASSCCSLPPLAGYRLDRLKQDFAVRAAFCLFQPQSCFLFWFVIPVACGAYRTVRMCTAPAPIGLICCFSGGVGSNS